MPGKLLAYGTEVGTWDDVCKGKPGLCSKSFAEEVRMFWVDGYPLGDMLVDILDRMAQAGVLLKDEDDVRYKWNPAPIDLS